MANPTANPMKVSSLSVAISVVKHDGCARVNARGLSVRFAPPKWYKFMDELLALDKKYWLKYCKSIPKKDAERIKEIINS